MSEQMPVTPGQARELAYVAYRQRTRAFRRVFEG